jgi:Nuclear cap-binding protein subunit 3
MVKYWRRDCECDQRGIDLIRVFGDTFCFCNVAMATAVWTEGNVVESASMASPPQPRHSAPPNMQQHVSQDAALEEVVWDDSMMDLDDYEEETRLQQRADPVSASGPQEEIKPTEIGYPHTQLSADHVDPSQVRTEAIHLRGVDNLSTDDVQLYVSTLYPSFESKIEWIDDTSLNVVYESADIATAALQTLSLNPVQDLEATTLRPAKPLFGEKSIEGLKARMAFMGDKKERGARDRSRWYLFNPHPAEAYERR